MRKTAYATLLLILAWGNIGFADPPIAMYIFPVGGQRGTDVPVRVGGLYLHDNAPFELQGPGVTADSRLKPIETIWFEGPVIPLPDSQQAEDYPKDHSATIRIADDAAVGARTWQTWTSQGATPSRLFHVGELPEVVEEEIDGRPIATEVVLPITINGRIFPREDVDEWSFTVKKGETISATALANSLGSPLELRMEIRDSRNRLIAESTGAAIPGADSWTSFVASHDDTYRLRVHDLKFGGLQHYVYRVSVVRGVQADRVFPLGGQVNTTVPFSAIVRGVSHPDLIAPAELDDVVRTQWVSPHGKAVVGYRTPIDVDPYREYLEPDQSSPNKDQVVLPPAVINGRIRQPGELDLWMLEMDKGQMVFIESRSAARGSPLDPVVTLADQSGKVVLRHDSGNGPNGDFQLTWTAPEKGRYTLLVNDRDPTRGGDAYAYRLRLLTKDVEDFRIELPTDGLSVLRGGEAKLKVKVVPIAGFQGEVELAATGLPDGVSVSPTPIKARPGDVELTFKVGSTARIGATRVKVVGTLKSEARTISRTARHSIGNLGFAETDSVLIAVSLPTPYQVKGVYELKYAQRGSQLVRKYSINRNGFSGPLTVRLADRQTRHLQGVSGPTIQIPPDATEFEYPVTLPPWMEIGRTSRSVVMAVGEMTESDGSKHTVSFTSLSQNEQIVALIDPGQLSLELAQKTARVVPGQELRVALRVGRGTGVKGKVRVELIVPRHIKGISADAITVDEDNDQGALVLRLDGSETGPWNQPLTLRATAERDGRSPVVAEAKLEMVPESSTSRGKP